MLAFLTHSTSLCSYVEFVSAGQSCQGISAMAQQAALRPPPPHHYPLSDSLLFLLQAHQRLSLCQSTCSTLAQALLHPPRATASLPCPPAADNHALQSSCDATHASFLPQLFAAFQKQQFDAAAVMLPAVAALRARAAAATASRSDHDALQNALQVVLPHKHKS